MVILICCLILLVGLTPAIASWWFCRLGDRRMYSSARLMRRYADPQAIGLLPSAPAMPPKDPERRYIRGLGYMIGDISCRFNARSGHLRCAVNPMGPCRGCSLYESVAIAPLDCPE